MKSFLSLKAHFLGVVLDSFGEGAPLKINMEPKNHLFEKENLGKGTLLGNNISPKKSHFSVDNLSFSPGGMDMLAT